MSRDNKGFFWWDDMIKKKLSKEYKKLDEFWNQYGKYNVKNHNIHDKDDDGCGYDCNDCDHDCNDDCDDNCDHDCNDKHRV